MTYYLYVYTRQKGKSFKAYRTPHPTKESAENNVKNLRAYFRVNPIERYGYRIIEESGTHKKLTSNQIIDKHFPNLRE